MRRYHKRNHGSATKNLASVELSIALILATTSMYLAPLQAGAQECAALLKAGIYDMRTNISSLDTARSFSNWFCSQNFSSATEADSFSSSIGLPIEGIPVKLGFDGSRQNWNEWYADFCQDARSSFEQHSRVEEYVSSINPQIVKVFNECVNANGLHVWLERRADPMVFAFAAKFVTPTVTTHQTLIQDFTAVPSVNCEPNPRGRPIGPSTFRSVCTRSSGDELTIAVNADFLQGGGDLSLSAIPKPRLQEEPLKIQSELKPGGFPHGHINDHQVPGCGCGPNSIITDPVSVNGRVGEWVTFRWDNAWICQGQGIKGGRGEGHIWWTGDRSELLPDAYGIAKVKYSKAGSYIVRLEYTATCIDVNCQNTCASDGNITINITE